MAVGKAYGTLLSVNPAWSKVLGFSESELRDISFGALFSDQEASLWEQVSEELMSLRPVLDLVAPMTARDGSLRHVSWTIVPVDADQDDRSEEHTSELQSLMRISYAVFCLKKK